MDAQVPQPELAQLLDYPVHPMAARFPMWPPDRLAELADDIAANGLNIPLVVWSKQPMLLDGRNRLAACNLAGIEPDVEFYDGEDPRVLIISRNIQTREMSASQKAMLVAVEFPEPKRGMHSDLRNLSGSMSVLLSQARQIGRWAGDLADGVIDGSIPFATALKTADENRQKASSNQARMARLQEGAPDLARQVVEGTLPLDEAEAAWRERERLQRSAVEAGKVSFFQIGRLPSLVAAISRARSFERFALDAQMIADAEQALAELRQMLVEEE